MKRVLALFRALWAKEPVIVGALLPLLVADGLITADQASLADKAIAAAVSLVVSITAVLKVRATVTAPKGK